MFKIFCKEILPGSKAFDSDLWPVVLSLHHGPTNSSYHGKHVDPAS